MSRARPLNRSHDCEQFPGSDVTPNTYLRCKLVNEGSISSPPNTLITSRIVCQEIYIVDLYIWKYNINPSIFICNHYSCLNKLKKPYHLSIHNSRRKIWRQIWDICEYIIKLISPTTYIVEVNTALWSTFTGNSNPLHPWSVATVQIMESLYQI